MPHLQASLEGATRSCHNPPAVLHSGGNPRMKRAIQAVVGLVIGLVLVWLLFRGTDWDELGRILREMHVGWFLLAQIPLWASFWLRVQRWTYIVRASHPNVSFRKMFAATQIGFLGNFTLPARLGEIVRAVVLTRITPIPFSQSFALVALDRVTDLFGLIAVMFVAVLAYQPTEDIVIPASTFNTAEPFVFPAAQYRAGAIFVAIVLLVVIGFFVLLYTNRRLVLAGIRNTIGRVAHKLSERLQTLFNQFADGLHVFRSPSDMAKSIFFSLTVWGAGILFNLALLYAFHIDFPWYAPFLMMALLAIFIAFPGPPGLVGQYHLPLVIAVVMVTDADPTRAKALAIVSHLVQFPPLIITAVYGLMTERLGLLELGRSSAHIAGHPEDAEAEAQK